jgi:uncharacterized protein with FMN-binding domain
MYLLPLIITLYAAFQISCNFPDKISYKSYAKVFSVFCKKEKDKSVETMKYVAGVYTSSILFHDSTLDVQVIVDENRINSISLVNLNETVTTMYPLVEPALEEVSDQIIKTQSVENISYQADNQYTTVMLLNAVENALEIYSKINLLSLNTSGSISTS